MPAAFATSGSTPRYLAVGALLCVLAACTAGPGGQPRADPAKSVPAALDHSRPTPRTTAAARSFSIVATGDVLAHEPVVRAAQVAGSLRYDFRPLLAPIRPQLLDADLAICHLETPLTGDRRITYYPNFSSPPQIAPALAWAGYDTCTTASNHTLDQGVRGVRTTLDALDAVGVAHTGAARNAPEQRPRNYTVRGVRVAHLDYTYGLNGRSVPLSAPWVVRLIDVRRILADAHNARRAGAQFVVLGLHWGQEYSSAATGEQRALARRLLASPDIDLILGCHAHVVQPIERIGGKFVVYGMGNLLAHHAPCCNTPPTRDGLLITAEIGLQAGRYAVRRLTYTPTYVDQRTSRVFPVAARLRDPRLSATERVTLTASWARTVARVNALGAAAEGVTPAGPAGRPTLSPAPSG
ncbi:MAG: CapA family protein [Frankiaceae bacterium]